MTLLPHERAFAIGKAQAVMEAMAANLRLAQRVPYALGPRPTDRRGTFVVCGAGPSLAGSLPEVARMAREGAKVCVVNTALPAFDGVLVPDVVLVREAVDVSGHLRYPARLRVLDLGASRAVWAEALAEGECLERQDCAWFLGAANHTFDLAWHLGVRPLFAGTAALTALVALCEEWGARRVVLVGADLAIREDGAAYSAGSAFSGQVTQIGADGRATHGGEGFRVKQEAHARSGLPLNPTHEDTIEVDRWGGGVIRTTAQWIDQFPWLVDFAMRYPEIECIDATGAGARKYGWSEVLLDRLEVTEGGETKVGQGAPPDFDRARAALLEQCETAISLAGTVTDPEGCAVAVPGLLRGMDLVEAAAAGRTLLAIESDEPTADRVRAVYLALSDSAARLAALLRE